MDFDLAGNCHSKPCYFYGSYRRFSLFASVRQVSHKLFIAYRPLAIGSLIYVQMNEKENQGRLVLTKTTTKKENEILKQSKFRTFKILKNFINEVNKFLKIAIDEP